MFCGFCGSNIPDDAVICPACGQSTGVEPAQENAAPFEETATAPFGEKAASPADSFGQQSDYGSFRQSDYQQPSYGAPAQPSYQQPGYGAPAQPSYQQPSYQQPSYQQPSYQQPSYQQSGYQQPSYQQQWRASAPAGSGTAAKVGDILSALLSALALAAVLVAAIVWIVDTVDGISSIADMKSYYRSKDYTNMMITLISLIVDHVVRLVCILVLAVLCLKKKVCDSAAAGVWMMILCIPTLKYLSSHLFDFELFGINYKNQAVFAYYSDGSFPTLQVIMIFAFFAAAIMFTATLANKNKATGTILAGITSVLLIAALVLTIVVFSKEIKPVNDYLSYSGSNEVARIHTQLVFAFLTMLFTILTMLVVSINAKLLKKNN